MDDHLKFASFLMKSTSPTQKNMLTLCEQHSQTLTLPCPLVHEGVLNVFYHPELKSPESWQVTVDVSAARPPTTQKGHNLKLVSFMFPN